MVISGQLHLQELQGTGGGWEEKKKVSLQNFLADHKIASMWKKFVLAL